MPLVVCCGDSNTGSTVRCRHKFPWRLADLLPCGYQVLPCGRSGTTAGDGFPYGAQPVFLEALRSDASFVVLSLGTNDASRKTDPIVFEVGLLSIIARVKISLPAAMLLIVSPLGCRRGLVELRSAAKRAAQRHGAHFVSPPLTVDDFVKDRIHLAPRGARVVAECLMRAMVVEQAGTQFARGGRVILRRRDVRTMEYDTASEASGGTRLRRPGDAEPLVGVSLAPVQARLPSPQPQRSLSECKGTRSRQRSLSRDRDEDFGREFTRLRRLSSCCHAECKRRCEQLTGTAQITNHVH